MFYLNLSELADTDKVGPVHENFARTKEAKKH